MQNLQSFASAVGRRLLGEVGNLPALSGNYAKSSGPVNSEEIQRAIDVLSLGSGSFSAFPNSEAEVLESAVNTDAAAMQSGAANQSTDEVSGSKHSKWAYFMIIPAAILLISLIVAPILVWRKRGRAAIGPWKTGLSDPLQKAFVTGKHSYYPICFYGLGSRYIACRKNRNYLPSTNLSSITKFA